jgi:hypothetical protein
MTRSIYTKLTPTKRNIFGYSQLWLAPDHILLLINSQFSEDYKRFALSDIQSIVVTELPQRVVPQVIMILAALAWMCLWFTIGIPFLRWAVLITGVLALLFPIVDIVRGRRCRCYLHTRVSKERLAPVARVKTARAFLAAVRPMIEAVQGVLLPTEADTLATPSLASQPEPPVILASPGYIPEALFALLIVNAVLISASVHYPKIPEIPGILINSLLAELLLIVVALARRRGRDPRVVIYVLIGLALIGFGFDVVTVGRHLGGWYLSLVEKARNGDKSPPIISLFPFGTYRATVAYSWRAAVGIIGLAAAFYERRKPWVS